MAFARSESVYTENDQDVMTYSCSIKYMTMRLKKFYPNITENDVTEIVTNGLNTLYSFVLDGIADEYKKRQEVE